MKKESKQREQLVLEDCVRWVMKMRKRVHLIESVEGRCVVVSGFNTVGEANNEYLTVNSSRNRE